MIDRIGGRYNLEFEWVSLIPTGKVFHVKYSRRRRVPIDQPVVKQISLRLIYPTASVSRSSVERMVREASTDAFRAKMRRWAREIVRDPDVVDDIVQDALLRLCRTNSPPRDGYLPQFMRRVVQNLCRDVRNAAKSSRIVDVDQDGLEDAQVYTGIEWDPEARAMQSVREVETEILDYAVDRLPDPYKAAVELYRQGLSSDEVSKRLLVPLNTAKTRIYRGRHRLAEMLNDDLPN